MQMQFPEPLKYPEGEIDLDAMRVEDLAVEFVRQSFANQQLVDFGASPLASIYNRCELRQSQFPRVTLLGRHIPQHHKISAFAGHLICQQDECEC